MSTRESADSEIITSQGNFRKPNKQKKTLLLIAGGVLFVGIILGVFLYMNHQSAANKQMQTSLQNRLRLSLNDQSAKSEIISYSSQLIDGQKKGDFKISNATLGQIYLDRANAYFTTNKNKEAASDYAKVATLNSDLTQASLQGQYYAGYRAGQRKELIPVLQKLIVATKKSSALGSSSMVEQYQGAINALQSGREINL